MVNRRCFIELKAARKRALVLSLKEGVSEMIVDEVEVEYTVLTVMGSRMMGGDGNGVCIKDCNIFTLTSPCSTGELF